MRNKKSSKRASTPNAIIDITSAHRFMIPFPEMAGAITMVGNCIESGNLEVYRNKGTGGLMMGHICPDCDTHHPLIEIHSLPDDMSLEDDRFIVQSIGCPSYQVMLALSDGVLHSLDVAHSPSRDLVRQSAYRFEKEGPSRAEDIFVRLKNVIEAIMEGEATMALDLESGMTALGIYCKGDCGMLHAAYLLAMPKFPDMRNAAGYEFIGNPFMDLMVESTGTRRS